MSRVDYTNTTGLNRKINKEVEKTNRKNKLLKEEMLELEQDNETLNNLLVDKENEIFHLQERLKDFSNSKQQLTQVSDKATVIYLKQIGELEAERNFKDEEISNLRYKL